ncbi:hypothetical protein ACHAXT_008648 [Thalassiosira profunda]
MTGSYDAAAADDEWIRTAGVEYERVASLCNAQALLCNAAAAATASSPLPPIVASDDGRGGGGEGEYDPKTLAAEMQRRNLHEALSAYYREIDAARTTHSSLKAQLASLSQRMGDAANSTGHAEGCRERTLPVVEAFSKHIELSERVIRTVMRSSSAGGPCGALHENGMLRPISAADHEANVVALAALRASVSGLKAKFGTGK